MREHGSERASETVREVRVMNERRSLRSENTRELGKISINDSRLDVDEGIKTEDEINRSVSRHSERLAVVDVKRHRRIASKLLAAMIDAVGVEVNGDQLLIVPAQETGPSPESWGDFQD
jgi:ribosomal 50S subunit-recycling heat shock protein